MDFVNDKTWRAPGLSFPVILLYIALDFIDVFPYLADFGGHGPLVFSKFINAGGQLVFPLPGIGQDSFFAGGRFGQQAVVIGVEAKKHPTQ